jgi:hypothetical protein
VVGGKIGGKGGGRRVNGASGEAGGGTLHLELSRRVAGRSSGRMKMRVSVWGEIGMTRLKLFLREDLRVDILGSGQQSSSSFDNTFPVRFIDG